ncbi:MAG: cation diffusion facilitator family transporter [Caulobacteraceae bacterium]|nr:cation diffusion facilitator family transporter [Caulobacteraceae bacterium]
MTAHSHDQRHPHDHGHDQGHGPAHGDGHHHGGGHHHHASPDDPRFGLAIALNLAIVAIEAGAGFFANSTALVADAGHNLSDVLGLVLAGGAMWLARQPARGQRTYGFGKATVLAALANGVVLMFVSGAIVLEAFHRLARPEAVQSWVVMATAGAGVVINTATALMFVRGRHGDVNVRGAFLHMAGDALVSVGVIVSAGLIALTHWTWLDPVTSIAIVAVIVAGTWGLLREAIDMALDAAPPGADVPSIHAFLKDAAGVTEVHDLHVWAMSTTEMALTAHLVRPGAEQDDRFRGDLVEALEHRFGVRHATLQIEQARGEHCPVC